MNTWEMGDVEANGLRLHYTRTGGNRPAVVLAHGFTDDGLCWTPVAEALAPDYDVVMLDARGHGRSEGPKQGYSYADHAADLAGVIAALGLRRPAVLGHSMGATNALALAGMYPEVPRAILLEDPPAWWIAAPDGDLRSVMEARIVALKRKTREELIAGQRRETPDWSEAELGPWADAKLRFSFYALNRETRTTTDLDRALRAITCPALLITAEPGRGSIVTPEAAAALQALVPQVQVAHIADAGHSIRRHQFARYMDVVRTFLEDAGA